jgi:SNF2 family DNA or RNA helicase
VFHGPRRRLDPTADVTLTTYAILRSEEDLLAGENWDTAILDEAQNIKNSTTRAANVVRELDARHRLCLTGTPLENHLGELWSLFHFLLPGFLGDERSFRRLYRTPIEKEGNSLRREQLARRVRPFLLRRTKAEVAAELPPKTEIIRSVELIGAQRDLYESVRVTVDRAVRAEIERVGLARSQIAILDALLKLRQVCCDPRLVKMVAARHVAESAKLALLAEMLPKLIEEGRRILIFSQFTSMLALIEAQLHELGIDYVLLTGDTRDREKPVKRFQAQEVPVFLISLKAGGTGLNLTAADTVIHYDPWWNPAVETQATDRAHRIGQLQPVFVYKLIVAGSVEERIVEMQQRKADIASAILAGTDLAATKLTRDDLAALFDPIEDEAP